MNIEDIIEFRTTWNNDLFIKNKLICQIAKRLIKKSILIIQIRSCRQLKYAENDRQVLKNYNQSNSLAKGLQHRLKNLQNEIDDYNLRIENMVQQEKDYWKQLEEIILKRTITTSKPTMNTNSTYITYTDKNNENAPPNELHSNKNKNKTRKKKKKVY
ncbi:unnamed protein product [Adineta steineri]|uniref:Uncharacterized protein n=1 Tax=Adineta steineri TaxID=433720 RepID=A0A814Z651_9BILA|nr:unnamed protein product [Adineta steineri]CAF0842748.1 unnamed protein product [Adineta steineri]CAF1240729.1 unnamed protein product [Adineta steineri]